MTTKEFLDKAKLYGWKYDRDDLPELAKHSWNLTEI